MGLTFKQALWKSAQLAAGGLVGITISECLKESLHVPLRDIQDIKDEPITLVPEMQVYHIRGKFLWRARLIDIGLITLGIALALPEKTRFFGLGIAGVAAGRLALQFENRELQSARFACPLKRLSTPLLLLLVPP